MKSLLIILTALLLVPGYVRAQEEGPNDALKDELSQEIDALYPAVKVKKKKVTRAPIQKIQKREIVTSQEIYPDGSSSHPEVATIDNSLTQEARASLEEPSSVEAQPTSYVEAAPLKPSRLDDLKRNRMEKERENEEKLIEKIEADRLQYEADRAKMLDGTFDRSAKTEATAQPVVTGKVQEFEPEPVINVSAASLKDDVDPFKEEEKTTYFVSALGGIGDYGSARNVKGVFSLGAAFGAAFSEGLIVEGDFIYSTYDLQTFNVNPYMPGFQIPTTLEMNHYFFGGALKYQFPTRRFRPVVGALGGYSYRTFRDQFYSSAQSLPSSGAFDAGLLIGANIKLSERFTLGTDIKYMMNISYRRDNQNPYTAYNGMYVQPGTKPVEEFNYWLFGVNGAFHF